MKLNRAVALGQSIRLALVFAGLLSTQALAPVSADQGAGALKAAPDALALTCDVSTEEALRPGGGLGACERALAACMNGGGGSDACWNAYWRCISNRAADPGN